MRTIPAGLADHLVGRATTIANIWILRRRDGLVLGFTDHDQMLRLDSVNCEPASGFDRSASTSHGDMAVGEEEITGGLTSDQISEADLAAGLWDGATVEVYVCDWRDPADHMLLRSGTIGEVLRSDSTFRAEVRGPAFKLDQPTGRIYARTCDAELGDSRCGVGLAGFSDTGTVATAIDPNRFRVTGIAGVDVGWYAGGAIAFTSGNLSGQSFRVDDHVVDDTGIWIIPWRPLAVLPTVGSAFTIKAGCDKHFATCKSKFNNVLNFRGFPHIPGRDFVFSYARGNGREDGGPLS